MKFDFIIGNPPYQEENEKNSRKPPNYHLFMDETYKLADKVELITPARFLFNAGQTPKSWNNKMLSDEHLKVLYYEPDSTKVFPPPTDIKGGVVVTYHDESQAFCPIGTFTTMPELDTILRKVNILEVSSPRLDSIISSRGTYKFTDTFFVEFPYAKTRIGEGTGNMIASNVFEKIPEGFKISSLDCNDGYYLFIGRINNKRVNRYIEKNT